uniref:Uncharacterized protein n=1 Tax=Anopheles quadriannulatus TaxID=34691 RepID=A0A182XS21_ANOQN
MGTSSDALGVHAAVRSGQERRLQAVKHRATVVYGAVDGTDASTAARWWWWRWWRWWGWWNDRTAIDSAVTAGSARIRTALNVRVATGTVRPVARLLAGIEVGTARAEGLAGAATFALVETVAGRARKQDRLGRVVDRAARVLHAVDQAGRGARARWVLEHRVRLGGRHEDSQHE